MKSIDCLFQNRMIQIMVVMIVAIGSLVCGQDEYMTCSRPIKASRTSKQLNLPCEGMEHGSESWCTLPGPMYPWHAVRNFVFENQGLMRRMYGEVRQLSLLRMEFAGESNAIEEQVSGRDFDDIFPPIMATSLGPTPASASTLVSMLATPSMSDDYESVENEDYNISSGESLSLPSSSTTTTTTTTTSTESPSSSIIVEIVNDQDDDDVNNLSDSGNNSSEKFTTSADEPSDAPTTTQHIVDGLIDTAPTEEVPTTFATNLNSSGESDLSPDGLSLTLQPPPPPSTSVVTNTTTSSVDNKNEDPNNQSSGEEKNRIENHVLFQDFEKHDTPASPPSTTTTEEPRVRSRVGVNACPVKEEVVAPYWANNTRGEILALLNLYPFEQYIHWEKCTNEHRQMYCRDGCRCEQQYRLHRLLAFDPSNECRGIFSDWFRFPSCCVCKCYFDEMPNNERISFNRSPRILDQLPQSLQDLDGPDVNGVDDSHFFYKYHHSFRTPRK